MKYLTFLILVSFSFICNAQKAMFNNSVVSEFDLERYLGTWYEIARYDHTFERGMVGVTANYTMRKDGKIKVLNSGYKGSLQGAVSEATGKAKIPNPQEPGKLKVAFFLFFYGDYYVMELDKEYQWAIIGSSSQKYLWILSRQPHITPELYADLLKRLIKRGYDTSLLIKVEQGISSRSDIPTL